MPFHSADCIRGTGVAPCDIWRARGHVSRSVDASNDAVEVGVRATTADPQAQLCGFPA